MQKISHILILLFFVTLTCFSFAQNNEGKHGKPIVLRFVDSMYGHPSEEGDMREFIGNVRLEQGDVFVYCDKAIQYLKKWYSH